MTRTPIPAAKLPAAGAPTDAPLSARPYIPPRDLEAIYRERAARHRIVPQESRLVMFFRDNGEDVTTYFAMLAIGLAVASVVCAYLGGGR